MAFVQRLLNFTITLGPPQSATNAPLSLSLGSLPAGSSISITGKRASVQIRSAGVSVGATASVKIWGLQPNTMNQLMALGMVWNVVPLGTIVIQAGSADIPVSQFATIFTGTYRMAYGDYGNAPDVPLCIEAQVGLGFANTSVPVASYPQSTTVAQVMQDLATKMKVNFENNGVTSGFNGPVYFKGTIWDQMQQARDWALPPISAELVDGDTTLAIWPRTGKRNTNPPIPLISPDTGMISYPAFSEAGLIVKTVFNPEIKFGKLVAITTSLPIRTGTWVVNRLDHDLDSIVPNGQWMSTLSAWLPNSQLPLPSQT